MVPPTMPPSCCQRHALWPRDGGACRALRADELEEARETLLLLCRIEAEGAELDPDASAWRARATLLLLQQEAAA